MGPKTKQALESIVTALREFPIDHHRQLLEWASNITSGQFTLEDVTSGRATWDRRGTWHEQWYPGYSPNWE